MQFANLYNTSWFYCDFPVDLAEDRSDRERVLLPRPSLNGGSVVLCFGFRAGLSTHSASLQETAHRGCRLFLWHLHDSLSGWLCIRSLFNELSCVARYVERITFFSIVYLIRIQTAGILGLRAANRMQGSCLLSLYWIHTKYRYLAVFRIIWIKMKDLFPRKR